jgi:hypothetical protein
MLRMYLAEVSRLRPKATAGYIFFPNSGESLANGADQRPNHDGHAYRDHQRVADGPEAALLPPML